MYSLEIIRLVMSYRTSLGKYIDSTALMALSAAGHSNISCTEDQCAFSGAVMSTELEVSMTKKR